MCACAQTRARSHVAFLPPSPSSSVLYIFWVLFFYTVIGGLLSAAASCLSCSEPASGLIESSKSPSAAPGSGLRGIIVMTRENGCVRKCVRARVLSLVERRFNSLELIQVEGALPAKHPHRAPLVPI